MTEAKVYLVGSGTCRIDPHRGQTSACVIHGDTTFIIDVGFGALERLERLGAFDSCRTLHIHISHRHPDHLIGLIPLLNGLTFGDDKRHLSIQQVFIHTTEEVCKLIDSLRTILGHEETSLCSGMRGMANRCVEYRPGPDFRDWSYSVGEISVRSVHLAAFNNHGVSFALNNKHYAFTADGTVLDDSLIDFCRGSDVCVFDFGHLTNIRQEDGSFRIDLSKVVTLLTQANARTMYASHIYLRHLQEQIVLREERLGEMAKLVSTAASEAQSYGFTGKLILAEDGMAL